MQRSVFRAAFRLLAAFGFLTPCIAPAEEPRAVETAATDEEAARRLRTRVDFDFDDAPLSHLERFVQERLKVEVHFVKEMLDYEGMSRDTPVSVHLRNVEAQRGLDLILRQLKLASYLEDGRLFVTTPFDERWLDRARTIRVYNCRDLLRLASPTPEPQYRGGDGMPPPTLEEGRSHVLLDMLMEADEIGSWKDCDDCFSDTEVRMFRGLFVFRARPEVHARIEKLLKMLRDAAGDELEKQ